MTNTYEIKCRPSIMKVPTLSDSLSNHHSAKSKSTYVSNSSTTEMDRSISFHSVKIREYDMTLGDNPASRMGPPVSIGWDHSPELVIKLDDYENERGERRSMQEMFLPRGRKYDIIKEAGVSNKQIARTVRNINKIKNQRMQTANNAPKFAKLEEGFESLLRKIKRFLLRRKSDRKWWAKWKKDNEDLLDLSTHNGRLNRVIPSNHSLERISSERSSNEDMSEISTMSSGIGPNSVISNTGIKHITCEEEGDLNL